VSTRLWDPPPRSVVVFRALQLGDMLCAVPALRALRRRLPDARITLAGLPWAQSFVQRFSTYCDDLLPFPGFPGFPEQEGTVPGLLDFLLAARTRQFDVAIQLHGSGQLSNRIVALMQARRTAGFVPAGEQPPRWHIAWPDSLPEIERYIALMAAIGVPPAGRDLELPISAADWEQWEALRVRSRLHPQRFVCIHPGARLLSRRWPVARFAAVAAALAGDGWPVVVTGSPQEAELTASLIAQLPPGAALDLTGQTTLGSLAALISKSALLVCNDTGVSHVAAAVGTPSVVIASGSEVHRWAPLDRDLHPVIWRDMPCRPCAYDTCPLGHGCALGVEVHSVIARARNLLQGSIRHAA
jgi:ADP-heptose:LPS heptosyltransferase